MCLIVSFDGIIKVFVTGVSISYFSLVCMLSVLSLYRSDMYEAWLVFWFQKLK